MWTAALNLAPLPDGTINFSVSEVDAAGNTATASGSSNKDTVTRVTLGNSVPPVINAALALVMLANQQLLLVAKK